MHGTFIVTPSMRRQGVTLVHTERFNLIVCVIAYVTKTADYVRPSVTYD